MRRRLATLLAACAALLAACAALLAACRGADVTSLAGPWENLPGETTDPALAVDRESGHLLLAWVAGDGGAWHLWTARSPDGGVTWSDEARVTTEAGQVHPHAEASPRLIVATAGRVAVVWTNSVTVPGRRFPASDLWSASSADGGRSWSAPTRVNDDAGGPPEGHTFHGAGWEGDGTLVVAWLDGRGMGAEARSDGEGEVPSSSAVWIARSTDFGRTWEPNRALWPSACPCCRVSLARGPDGSLVAGWREHFAGDVRDVVVAPVPRADAPPAKPQRVRDDRWVYPACPHSGPAVARDAQGRSHVAWFTGKPGAAGVYYAQGDVMPGSGAFGTAVTLVAAPELPIAHPDLVALPGGGAAVAWDVGVDGARRLQVARVTAGGEVVEAVVVSYAADADHPRLAPLPDGGLVVAWTIPGAPSRARLARVELE